MSWKRRVFSSTLRYSGMLEVLSRLRKYSANNLTVLAYHRIGERVTLAGYPYDTDLVSATAADFEWQMRYVERHFKVVTFAQVAAFLDGRADLPPRALIVTFDDGFDDNYQLAFPILKRIGIPATMFVSTGYIGQQPTFWFDRVVYLIKNSSKRQLSIDLNGAPEKLDEDIYGRYRQAIELVVALRSVADENRLDLLAEVEQQLGADLPAVDPRSQPMTWEMVAEMADAGIEIGSHTVSHPNLVQLNPARLHQELSDSRLAIEQHTGQKPVVIAYPVGDRLNFNDEVIDAVKKSGYRLAVSYISGVNSLVSLDRYALTRLHVESYTGKSEFAATLEFPGQLG